jgi:hypothetical protein
VEDFTPSNNSSKLLTEELLDLILLASASKVCLFSVYSFCKVSIKTSF